MALDENKIILSNAYVCTPIQAQENAANIFHQQYLYKNSDQLQNQNLGNKFIDSIFDTDNNQLPYDLNLNGISLSKSNSYACDNAVFDNKSDQLLSDSYDLSLCAFDNKLLSN
eukprot:Pgem_evm1s3413